MRSAKGSSIAILLGMPSTRKRNKRYVFCKRAKLPNLQYQKFLTNRRNKQDGFYPFPVLKAWQLLIWNICNLNISRRQSTNKERYIRKERQKTKIEFIVPLHSIVEALINQCKEEQPMNKERQMVKEKGNGLVFHCNCSRRVMNVKLSIVSRACGIRE